MVVVVVVYVRGGVLIIGEVRKVKVREVPTSILFFLAFMMLGSLAYRGSFRRRSAVTTSGVPTWITSVPLSVSRSAVTPPSANVSSEAIVAW